jgi:hypothetical protein
VRPISFLWLRFPQHPDDDSPCVPILLQIDQELSERSRAGVGLEVADPRGPFEIRQQQHVEEFGPRCRPKRVESLAEHLLELGDRGHP